MKILTKRAKDITKLLLPYKPTQILSDLANYTAQDSSFYIAQVHFFPLGGIKRAAVFVEEFSNSNP